MLRVASLCFVIAVGGCLTDAGDSCRAACIESEPGEQHPGVTGELVLEVEPCSDIPGVHCDALMAGARMQAWVSHSSEVGDGNGWLASGDLDVVRFVDVHGGCGVQGTLITGVPGEVLLALNVNAAPVEFFPVRVVRGATLTIVSPTGAPPKMAVGERRDYVLHAQAEDGELLHPGAIEWGSDDSLAIRVDDFVTSATVTALRVGSGQIVVSTDSLQASLRIDVQ